MRKKFLEDDVLTLARQRVSTVFDRFDHVAVSFSGGKDSTAVLQLTLEELRKRKADGRIAEDQKLDVFFWDEEAVQPETEAYIRRVAAFPDVSFRWYCIPVKHVNACSPTAPYWYPWAPEDREKWCRPLPPEAITDVPGFERTEHFNTLPLLFDREIGTVGLMTGIRAIESLRRYRSVTNRIEDNWLGMIPWCKRITQCKPVYDWSTEDVWTAPARLGWDYNRAYDEMAKAGISPYQQRVAPPFGQQPLENLWMWQTCWPELWDRVSRRVPGAATAARYSRSPLYGRGAKMDAGPSGNWDEALSKAIARWEPETRLNLAKRIARDIARHNAMHPGVPIPAKEAHYDLLNGTTSGLTYEFLLRVATKGDIKGRMGPEAPSREGLEERRKQAWGEDWATRYPEIAAKTFWNGRAGRWEKPRSP